MQGGGVGEQLLQPRWAHPPKQPSLTDPQNQMQPYGSLPGSQTGNCYNFFLTPKLTSKR